MIETLEESSQTFVLLPHVPDWNTPPTWSRRWKPDKAAAITGHEDRVDLGAAGVVSLSFKLDPIEIEERAALVARILEAHKSGLAASPYWGRAGKLLNDANATTLILEPTRWEWTAGDLLWIRATPRDAYLEWETATVATWTPETNTIILEATLSRNYPAGTLLWPILFGNFESDALAAASDYHASLTIQITQRRPWNDVQPLIDACAITLAIGADGGGDSFECHADGEPLDGALGGTYFAAAWQDARLWVGLIDIDTFEQYLDGAFLNGLTGGEDWSAAWKDARLYNGLQASDSFEDYLDGTPLQALDAGTGFAAAWQDNDLDI